MIGAHRVNRIRMAEERAAARVGWDALMQQAARGLADVLFQLIPEHERPVFLIGPGNNGGDALFAAAHWCKAGRSADICLLAPDQVHSEGLAAAGAAGAELAHAPAGHSWAVDALFGIGGRTGLTGKAADWAKWANASGAKVIAVDVPSGVGVDDGTAFGETFNAARTVTFGAHKIAGVLGPASMRFGNTTFVDIGLGEFLGVPDVEVLEFTDGYRYAELAPEWFDHKYSRGVLGIIAGSKKWPGAAHLTTAGALAGPIGMARYLGPRSLADRVVDRAPEVVPDDGRVQGWVYGPGLDPTETCAAEPFSDQVPVLVDATALGDLPKSLPTETLLTPHAGELAALLEVDRSDIENDPLAYATAAAQRFGCTVLLKGARTLIAAPDGRIRANQSGTPWLGTAGAGDVLAGFTGSLLAAGLDTFEAASVGALLHGTAAERVNPGGPITASGIARALPAVLAEFLNQEAR